MKNYSRTAEILRSGVEKGLYPGAVLSTGDKDGEQFRMHYGYKSLYPEKEAMREDTLFDMASLSKVMSTTMIALKLIEAGKLRLTDKLGDFYDVPADKKAIRIHHLMTHTSGLPSHVLLEQLAQEPSEVYKVILGLEPLYAPGSDVTYSCLGYILLGRLCEMLQGSDLSDLAKKMVFEPLSLLNTSYKPDPANENIARTEYNEKLKTWLRGVVHDENARFMRGIAGNAGIFSDINDCVNFALMLANRGELNGKVFIDRALFNESLQNYTAELSEGRGLGFVIKDRLPSSAGTIFKMGSYGHTGFTGTSLWVDAETSQYVVLLTNRVHPTRENGGLIPYRKTIHDACAMDYRGE